VINLKVTCFAVLLLIVYVLIFYFHEAGHYYAAKLVKCKIVEMNFTTILLGIPVPNSVYIEDEEVESSKPKTFFHLIGGIILGFVPIVALYLAAGSAEQSIVIVLMLFYFVEGCSSDFMQLYRLFTNQELL
jgi:hypothetical protein